MLTLLVLCAFLPTLRGASVPPPHAHSSVAAPEVSGGITCGCPTTPDDGGLQRRTVYKIVKSCLLTIFACVWTSAHPNINGPRDSSWTCMKRKVFTTLCVLMAPELVLWWALRQRFAAQKIAERYNEEFAQSGKTKISLWQKVVARFQPLPRETTWRGDGQLWTITHGFFIQMGGFMLYDNGYPAEVLDYDRLAELLRGKAIDAPTVTERNLQDRSKGDTISKAIVVLQTTWFAFQCFARRGEHLLLSELEVLTLAFAVMNAAIYAAWWNKPQGVDTVICVPLKHAENNSDDSSTARLMEEEQHELANLAHTQPPGLPQAGSSRHPNRAPFLPYKPPPRKPTGKQHSWLGRRVQADLDEPMLKFLVRLLFNIPGSVVRLLAKLSNFVKVKKKDALRMPMFYAADVDSLGPFIACVMGMVFGAIHLLALASEFPSPEDLKLWSMSAILLTVVSFMMLLAVAMDRLEIAEMTMEFTTMSALLTPFYIAAQFALIIISVLAIRHPSPHVLLDVSWPSYIPHF